jgi:hypothetical protein
MVHDAASPEKIRDALDRLDTAVRRIDRLELLRDPDHLR